MKNTHKHTRTRGCNILLPLDMESGGGGCDVKEVRQIQNSILEGTVAR